MAMIHEGCCMMDTEKLKTFCEDCVENSISATKIPLTVRKRREQKYISSCMKNAYTYQVGHTAGGR